MPTCHINWYLCIFSFDLERNLCRCLDHQLLYLSRWLLLSSRYLYPKAWYKSGFWFFSTSNRTLKEISYSCMFSLQWNTSADRTGHRSHGGSLLFCILLQPYVFSCCCYHPQIFFLRKDWNRLNHLPLSINSKNPYITLPCSLEESFKAKCLQTFALVSSFFMFGLILFLGGDFFSNTEFFFRRYIHRLFCHLSQSY